MRAVATKPPYATSRAHHVNFGDKTLLRADQRKQLVDISVADAQPFTCYVTARVEPAAAPVFPVVLIEWGNGGASIEARELRVYRRLRVPVVASTVRLAGRLVDAAGASLSPSSKVTCNFVAFVAPGADGETLRNTQWTSQHGAEGLVSNRPEQLVTVQGYPAAAAARWLMLFDAIARPADGAYPAMAVPAKRAYRLDRFDSQGFRYGVYWAASSTPISLTFDPGALLRVDVEVLT